VFGNRLQNRFNQDDNAQSPTRLHQSHHRRPIRGGKHYSPSFNAHDMPSSGRQSWGKSVPIGSGNSNPNNIGKRRSLFFTF
jgi:hypothetical protein